MAGVPARAGVRSLQGVLGGVETECREQRLPGAKQGIVLFNDALNTFYLRLYGVGHMVKDH